MNNHTILIADDDPGTPELLADLLRQKSYNCLIANSGQEAVKIYQEKKDNIDLVLLDWLMPGMNGDETLLELRKLKPDVMVVMISAYGDRAKMTKSIQLGARGYIHKPISDDGVELLTKIDDLLQLKRLSELDHLAKMGDLAGKIAHYMKNAIWNISGRIQLLMAEQELMKEPTVREYLETIKRLTEESNRVLFSLLHYAKKLPEDFTFQDVSIESILADILNLFKPEIHKKKISSTLNNALEKNRVVKADRLQLGTALLNIYQNAVEAVEVNGHIQIFCRFDDATRTVEVRIEDNGPGIPAEVMDNIFKPFYSTKENGVGLGLSVAKEIVEKHQGTISVDSHMSKGTAVTIKLNARA